MLTNREMQLFDEKLGISAEMHAKIDAELAIILEKLENGTLKTRPIGDLFERTEKLIEMVKRWEETRDHEMRLFVASFSNGEREAIEKELEEIFERWQNGELKESPMSELFDRNRKLLGMDKR